MSNKTKIEWTAQIDSVTGEVSPGATWNPTLGCSKKSPGCKNCYAIRTAHRLQANPNPKIAKAFEGLTVIQGGQPNWTGRINFIPDRLEVPLRTRKPTTFFVNSLSDLFHDDVSDEQIYSVFSVMHQCPQHTFQILTKEAERMHWLCSNWIARFGRNLPIGTAWPLPNVWLGVSVENPDYKHRIDTLRDTPAALRFLSLEPLLGDLGTLDLSGIGWVIVGGESGPGARPSHPDWYRTIRDQCQAAGVPFFFKQWGEYVPGGQVKEGDEAKPPSIAIYPDGLYETPDCCSHTYECISPNLVEMLKVGKKRSGALLDGREWREMPNPEAHSARS